MVSHNHGEESNMSRNFGYIQYKPSKARPTRIVASFPTPPEAFGRWPDLRERVSKTFRVDEEVEARAWLRRQRLMLDAGTWQPEVASDAARSAGRVTMAQYWPVWFAARRTRSGQPLREQTRYRMRCDAENHILPYFGSTRLVDIDRSAIDRWLDSMPREQEAMRANALKLLLAILRTAARPGPHGEPPIIAGVPYERPAGRPPKRHETVPATPEQVHAIYEAMPERYRLAVYLSVFCRGLRISEVCALQRRHVDLERRVIHIQQARLYMGGSMVGETKTDGSRRDETIPSQIVGIIQTHLDALPDDGEAWLFPAVKNPLAPIHPNTMRHMYDKARAAAGRPDLRFHDLRHTALTWLAQDGATLRELMDSAGHTTTENAMRYQHAVSDRDALLSDKLGSRLISDDVTSVRERLDDIDRRIAELNELRAREEGLLHRLPQDGAAER